MGNESFDAVKRFQEIRKSTNEIGHVGDTVTALTHTIVKGKSEYRIVTGIVVMYRSDAGRVVLDESGTEHSLSTSDVRKYVAPKENPAHEDYLTTERFREIKAVAKGIGIYDAGDSVAALIDDGSPKLVFGNIYGDAYNPSTGIHYKIITRDGERYVGIPPKRMARI